MQRFSPKEYLKIDIASNFGLDKKTWKQRIEWFDAHESGLMEMMNQADEPALFFAGVQAWEATKRGESTGYMISLDATSSGLQLLAALTGDIDAAMLCNVVDDGTDTRKDAYTLVYNEMLRRLGGESAQLERDDVKQAVMTALYGSQAVPKTVFGEGALLDLFYKVMLDAAPGAWELNEAFLALWDGSVTSHDWVMPDNFHVHIKVMDKVKETVHFLNGNYDVFYNVNIPMEQGRSLGANTTHSLDGMVVREMTRRCMYNQAKVSQILEWLNQKSLHGTRTVTNNDKLVIALWDHYNTSGYLSARIIEALDLNNLGHVEETVIRDLLLSLPSKPFNIISIHDCFRCHPNYGNDLREQYNRQLMLIAKSNLLSFMISQIIKRPVQLGKLHPKMWEQVLEAEYALS